MTVRAGDWLAAALVSMTARVVLAGLGVVLLGFFAMNFLAAFASGSWLRLLIAGYILVAAVCSFRYAWTPKRSLLFVVAPALLLLLVMLSGLVLYASAT
jgi:hypothetical protein